MPLLLVIAPDQAFLPQGWVSAILPDGLPPSDFERTSGLWKIVEVPASPGRKKWRPETMPRLAATGWRLEEGGLREIKKPAEFLAGRLKSLRGSLSPLPGPPHLDRSHSTVWDYGPGHTYSTPQAALDALLLQTGGDPFTETHFLRGYGGTFPPGPSGYVLHVTTLSPSSLYPLVLEAAEGQEVRWDAEGGDACLVGNGVSHVRVRDLKFRRAGVAVAPTEDAEVRDWWVERCEADGAAGDLACGVSVIRSDDLRVLDCDLHDLFFFGVGGLDGYPPDYAGRVEIIGSRITAFFQGLWNNAPVSYLLGHNTIRAGFFGIRHTGTFPLLLTGMINNIFTGTAPVFHCLSTELEEAEVRILHSDGNCFHPGPQGWVAALGQAELDLAAFWERFGQDAHSLQADPQLDSRLFPLPASPCRASGVCLHDRGWDGKRRAASVDIGFAQLTEPRVPTVSVRQAPEIGRRT